MKQNKQSKHDFTAFYLHVRTFFLESIYANKNGLEDKEREGFLKKRGLYFLQNEDESFAKNKEMTKEEYLAFNRERVGSNDPDFIKLEKFFSLRDDCYLVSFNIVRRGEEYEPLLFFYSKSELDLGKIDSDTHNKILNGQDTDSSINETIAQVGAAGIGLFFS